MLNIYSRNSEYKTNMEEIDEGKKKQYSLSICLTKKEKNGWVSHVM